MKRQKNQIRAAGSFDAKPYRSALFRAKNKRSQINTFKMNAPLGHIPLLIEDLCKVPALRVHVIKNAKPASVSEISDINPLSQVDLERELAWNVSVFLSMSDDLKSYIEKEKLYYNAILSSDSSTAITILDDIKETFGLSYWLINAYLCTYSQAGLIDKRSDFTKELLRNNARGFSSFVAYHLSRRGDRATNPAEYLSEVSKELSTSDISEPLREYLRSILLPIDDGLEFDAANILSYDEVAPIVDRYHSLVNCLVRSCEQDFFKDKMNFYRIVYRLGSYLNDDRLLAVCDHVLKRDDDARSIDPTLQANSAIELYTQGYYSDSAEILAEALRSEPTQVALWEVAAKSLAHLEPNSRSDVAGLPEPVVDMAKVHLREAGYVESLSRLERFALMDCYRPASLAVRSFLERETWLRWSDETTLRDSRVALLCRIVTPWYRRALIRWCGRDRAQPPSHGRSPNSDTLQSAENIDGITSLSIPLGRKALYAGAMRARSGDTHNAISEFEQALTDEFGPTRYEAAKRLVAIHRADAEYPLALSIIGEVYAHNQKCANTFDIRGILDDIENGYLQSCYNCIGLPIAYDIYSRHVGPDKDPAKSDAAEEFAVSMGVDLPSQIDAKLLPISSAAIYYLEHVCTTHTLESFINLGSSADVDLERVAICQVLTDLNPSSGSKYAAEITDITRRQVVKERLKQVEQSKIYVDLQNIRKKADGAIKGQFYRYQSMMASPEHTDDVLKVLKTIREYTGQRELTFQVLSAPTNPLQVTFEQLVRDVFLLLVTSREHGLETYLSTRIRHGTLSGHLRSPLEVHRVITQKDDTGDSYKDDTYWRLHLELPDHVSTILSDLIREFSKRVDDTIDLLNKSWIQILDSEHPEGMFDFRTFREDLYSLRVDIESDTEFSSFLDSVISLFWKSTESNLSAIRSRITGDFKDRITAAFDELHREATERLPSSGLFGFFASLTAARTDVQNAIDGVAGWFQVTDRLEYPDYSFDIAVEVAAKSVESSFRHMPIKLTTSLDVARDLRGDTLSSVVDLLFILLENAVTKSQLGRGPSVSVRAIGDGNALLLEVENEIRPVANPVQETEGLRERVPFSETSASRQLVAQEGGSGFPKIMRIITHDLSMKYTIDARYSKIDKFRVDLSLHDGEIFV